MDELKHALQKGHYLSLPFRNWQAVIFLVCFLMIFLWEDPASNTDNFFSFLNLKKTINT